MNPPIVGPKDGPKNGDPEYTIIGKDNSCLLNMSPIVPPATLRKALPTNPTKKRATSRVCIFCATAQGIMKMKRIAKETM